LFADGSPAIPRGHRAVGPEAFARDLELLRRRQPRQSVGQRVAVAHAIVTDRPHVEPAQLENEEHLGGPASDAAHDRQARDDLLVGEPADAMQGDCPSDYAGSEIPDRRDLAA